MIRLSFVSFSKFLSIFGSIARHITNIIGQLAVLVPNSNILVMAPNYSLSQISWDEQKRLLDMFEIEMVRCNNKDRIMELQNGSTIRIGSIGQANSVVGRSYDLIIFDEAALDEGVGVGRVGRVGDCGRDGLLLRRQRGGQADPVRGRGSR